MILNKDGEAVDAQGTPLPPRVKVVVLLPARGHNPSGFTYDLAGFAAFTWATIVHDGVADVRMFQQAATYVDKNRCELAAEALKDPETTHLMWLDDDMRFPSDALLQLLNRNVDIVGANYAKRRMPIEPVTIKRIANPPEMLYTAADATGLEEVDAVGFGVCLVRRRVFDAIAYPWFEQYFDRNKKVWVGEDVSFCMRARKAGFTVHIDHDLSHPTRHIGDFEYSMDHARAVAEERGTQ